MKAVRYHLSIPRYLLQRALGRRWPALYYRAPFSCLRLDEIAPPALPGPGWGRIRPRLAGICGTDMGTITGKNSPSLSPFVSFPAVLGHEVVGELVEVGSGAATAGPLQVGRRVVIDPALPCHARELTPACPACQRGETYLCERTADGRFAPGMILGFCRDLPGAWAEEMVAPLDQMFDVPDELSDEQAVLVEPLSVAIRAVLRGWPKTPGERILVMGAGTIGLSLVAALRLLGAASHVTVTARYGFQEEMAYRLGADKVYRGREAALAAARQEVGVRSYRPVLGPPVYTSGFDTIFDSIGSHATVDQALRLTRAGGRVVLVGAAGQLPTLDWTFVWSHELSIIGSCGYGREHQLPDSVASWFAASPGQPVAPAGQSAPPSARPASPGDQSTPPASPSALLSPAPHTFEITLEALRRHPDYPVADLVTHRFPLAAFRQAVALNVHHGAHKVIKTIFEFKNN